MNVPLPHATMLFALLAACASPTARHAADDARAAADLPLREGGEEDRDATAADRSDAAFDADVSDTPYAPDAPEVLADDSPDASPDASLDAPTPDLPDVAPPCATGVRCGDVCVDTETTIAHCGACGARCVVENGTPRCDTGRCAAASCNPDYALVDGSCRAIPVPRPLFPLSGLSVTARQPTLRWVDGAGADGAVIQLCRDRAMTVACIERPAFDGAWRPSAPLAPGGYFWRVRGRVRDTSGTTPSPVWMFYVGRGQERRPVADTAAHSFVDFNADGYPDAVFGTPGFGTAPGGFVVFAGGGAAWAGAPPAGRAVSPPVGADPNFGGTLATGDFNGDGYADLAAAKYLGGTRAHLYRGGPSGLEASADALTLLRPVPPTGDFGWSLSAIDVNGDGLQDLLVGCVSPTGAVYVYAGTPMGLATTPSATLMPPHDSALLAGMVRAVGDVDGDGYGDAILLSTSSARSIAWLHRGSPAGLAASGEVLRITAVPSVNYSEGGDVDGDSLADIVVSSRAGSGTVEVLWGHRAGTPAPAPMVLRGSAPTGGFGGSLVADLNGDGFSDVLADRTRSDGMQVYEVFAGGPAGLSSTSSSSASLTIGSPQYVYLGATRDLDGDGFAEFALSTGFTATPGMVQLLPGSATGILSAPRWTLLGAAPGGAFGLGMLPSY